MKHTETEMDLDIGLPTGQWPEPGSAPTFEPRRALPSFNEMAWASVWFLICIALVVIAGIDAWLEIAQ